MTLARGRVTALLMVAAVGKGLIGAEPTSLPFKPSPVPGGVVIIAIPAAPGREVRDIVTICEKAGVPTKIMPGLYEMLGGTVSVNQLRNVQIEDLLRREPVQTDTEAVRRLIVGKRVLVTGGGGSIGSEICRQILRFRPSDLMVLGHGENSIFEICAQLELQLAAMFRAQGGALLPTPRVHPVIADIRFPDRIQAVFEQYRPHIIFHAAAHKHVPLMEVNPTEAISNNVLGTRNLLDAAVMTGVERFVMISTDKAVRPKSVMGASKRVAELLVHQTAWEIGRPYVAVRFGNVLGSRGSVLQTFKRQIAAGGPITITHPDMTRYFMTIAEAVQLVLQVGLGLVFLFSRHIRLERLFRAPVEVEEDLEEEGESLSAERATGTDGVRGGS